MNARVVAEGPIELAPPDVQCNHAFRSRLEQNLGEPAGGRTDIDGVTPGDPDVEVLQGLLELVAAATDEPAAGPDLEGQVDGNPDSRLLQANPVGGDLARLMASARTSQAEVERVADTLNLIELSLAKLEKRVADDEEWEGSVDAFRRQVNASLSELQATLHSHQAGP